MTRRPGPLPHPYRPRQQTLTRQIRRGGRVREVRYRRATGFCAAPGCGRREATDVHTVAAIEAS